MKVKGIDQLIEKFPYFLFKNQHKNWSLFDHYFVVLRNIGLVTFFSKSILSKN